MDKLETTKQYTDEELEQFVRGYKVSALWSTPETNEDGEILGSLDDTYSIDDIAAETQDAMQADCVDFLTANYADIAAVCDHYFYNMDAAGHDFWLTRNGHGAGFWDRGWGFGDIGRRLTDAAKVYGSFNLTPNEDRVIYGS